MNGPCSYSMMQKPFDNVLYKYQINTQQLFKKLENTDWELKLEHVGSIGATQCCVKNNIVGKYKVFGIIFNIFAYYYIVLIQRILFYF